MLKEFAASDYPFWIGLAGLAFGTAAFFRLAWDVHRIHGDITTKRNAGSVASETKIRKRLADQEEEYHRWQETYRGKLLNEQVTHENLKDHLRDQGRLWHDVLELIEATRLPPVIDNKVSTERSKKAMVTAGVLFVIGIILQAISLLPSLH